MAIRDLGYQPYRGPRLGSRTRFSILALKTATLSWNSALVKVNFILGMFPLVACGIIMYGKLKLQQGLSGQAEKMLAASGQPLLLEDAGLWAFHAIYWCQIWFAFVASLIIAAPAISKDMRTGAFQFYFARPISRQTYLFGKLIAVAILIVPLSAIPGLLLCVERIALSANAGEALGQLPLLAKTLLYIVVFSLSIAAPALALGTLSPQTGYVQGAWAAVFFFPWLLGEAMAATTGIPHLALCSIPTNLRLVGQHLYGAELSYSVAWTWPAAVLLLVIVGSAAVVIRRLRKIEVFV
jgi:hypothetical protein